MIKEVKHTVCLRFEVHVFFSLFVFVLPVNWNGATWRRILCLQSPLHATIVHKPPPTPYVYLCSMLLMASTYVWMTLLHVSCFSFCQLQGYIDIIIPSKAGKAKYISMYLFAKAIPEAHPGCSLWSCTLQAGDGLWARFRWTLIWQCTHHKTHCVFGACLLWRILCTLPTSRLCNCRICRLDDGAIKFSATVSSESSRVPERNPRNNFSELVEKIH